MQAEGGQSFNPTLVRLKLWKAHIDGISDSMFQSYISAIKTSGDSVGCGFALFVSILH